MKVLQPDYVSLFECIGSDCDDTCCSGWRVRIDKETYDKYASIMNSTEGEFFKGKITLDDVMQVEGNYGEFVLSNNTCPFLSEKRLCRIQEKYGESFLSNTCSVFPRNYNLVNGNLELSLKLSCPHAARIVLSEPNPINFFYKDIKDDQRIYKLPTVNLTNTGYPDSVLPYFKRVRSFIIALLQNRNYSFEDRLIILGRYCNDLNMISSQSQDQIKNQLNTQMEVQKKDQGIMHTKDQSSIQGKDKYDKQEVLQLTDDYSQTVESNGFGKLISNIPKQPGILLKTLIILIEYRLKTGMTGESFSECFQQFKQGINYSSQISDEALSESYIMVKSKYYENFIKDHEYVFENYFVNYVFKNIFPFGNEKNIYKEDIFLFPKTIFSEYMLLAIHYAMIKNLLVGIAGFNKDKFAIQYVIKLIQSFDKNIGEDVLYQHKILKFFDDNKMLNYVCTMMLIKN